MNKLPPSEPPSIVSAPPPAGAVIGRGAITGDRRAAVLGATWMLLAGICFTAMSAIMKHLGASLPTSTIVFFRMAVGLAVVLPIAWMAGGREMLATRAPGRQAVRSFFGAASLACMVYAVHALPFATATALAFTTPLWIVVLSWIFLGERPSRWALVSAAVGFAGVLVIARPVVVFEPAIMVALAGALAAAAALTMVRALSARDRSLTIVVWFSVYGTLYSLGPVLAQWTTPSWTELPLLCSTGALGVAGLFCSAQAYRTANAAVVAPVDFARLPVAAVVGVVVFAEIPDIFTALGALLILAALSLTIADPTRRR